MTINYTTGYAGTGKSTELLNRINQLNPDTTVILCPTHKAIARLNIDSHEVKTIHALLGWVPTINEDAEELHQINTTMKLGKELEKYTNIVIDEGGMMSEEMFTEIIDKVEAAHDYDDNADITIDVYLDPFQLKPVKGVQIRTDPDTTKNLTTQHRAESPDIVKLFTKFVNYLQGNNLDLTIKYSENIKPLDITKFKAGDRLVAYTNEKVGEWNQKIAKQLGIDSYIGQEVQLGSQLDLFRVDSFEKPTVRNVIDAYNSGTLVLQDNRINPKWLEQNLSALVYHPEIEFIKSEGKLIPVIVGIGHANRVLKNAKLAALDNKSDFKHVYTLGRAFIMDYSFATTVHKAQGSEFQTVFVDKEDIKKSIFKGYYETYARLMYVGISRAIKTLFI